MATIRPAIAGRLVRFKVWDVDDPFDQLHAVGSVDPIANVGIIDGDTRGPDNRPVTEAPRTFSATTDANGKARVTFTVSMQPGNNYRAGATCVSDVFDATNPQVTQTDADAINNEVPASPGSFSGFKTPVIWSPMLTVWRKLHVEVDSMGAVTGNEIDVPFTDIVGAGTALTEVRGTGSLDDGSKDLDDVPPQNGRFENGTLIVGTAPSAITISPIIGNGNNRVVFATTNITGLPFSAIDNDRFGNGTMSGTITEVTKSGSAFTWSLNIITHNETPIDWPDFVGGTLTVGGGANVSIVGASATAATLTTNVLNIPCIVRDDDDNTLLPKFPDTSQLAAAYKPAYVAPVFDVGDNNSAVPFVLNVQSRDPNANITTVMDWDSQALNATDFWVAYLLEAYQDDTSTDDADPDSEGKTFGITSSVSGGSLIYLEVHQMHEGIATPISEEQITVVHELSHVFGTPDSIDPSLPLQPLDANGNLTANSLKVIRGRNRPDS